MRVKFKEDVSYVQHDPKTGKVCPERSRQHKAGEVVEVADDYGNRWIRRGKAEEVVDEPRRPAPRVEKLVPAEGAKA